VQNLLRIARPWSGYKAAINGFNQVHRLHPIMQKAYVKHIVRYQFVQYSEDSGKAYSKVINDFDQARLNPQEAEAYLKRGIVHWSAGNAG